MEPAGGLVIIEVALLLGGGVTHALLNVPVVKGRFRSAGGRRRSAPSECAPFLNGRTHYLLPVRGFTVRTPPGPTSACPCPAR
jgi:hypothetical protein